MRITLNPERDYVYLELRREMDSASFFRGII